MSLSGVQLSDTLHEYVGAIHVHTLFSDGRGTVEEIVETAASVELDFLLFSDHMTLEPLKLGLEGWYGKTLALIGYEINDPGNKNHYLAFGLKDTLPEELSAGQYVSGVREQGGVGFIAHPDETRTIPQLPPYPWLDWSVDGFDGIEIWNHSSEWVEGLKPHNILRHLVGPRSRLKGPHKETLTRWDRLNLQRRVAGIGSTDAHEHVVKRHFISIRIFPYKVQFKAIRTHILVDKPLSRSLEAGKRAVYDALVQARAFVSNFRWGDARGFRFWADHAGVRHQMGARVPYERGMRFHVRVPQKAKIALLCNGEMIDRARSSALDVPIERPGAYRVEVRRRGKPWIFSNHIVLV